MSGAPLIQRLAVVENFNPELSELMDEAIGRISDLERLAESRAREIDRLKLKLCPWEGCQASDGLHCRLADECNE